ncbi:acyl-CoA thioesterase [Fimbriimonadia bacterium ATM]|nr:MAG: acyl-CoA thioesterase [Armatimonadota bacterium]MBC6969978.1 acyl-CoA thioesterase [Armatimonadota bacterium]MCE7900248.1 acyl-CoA thioesterase [Armatimonadetes bacterium ATM1]MDL1928794.1 acyl-CoA thioesterase [Fimbriimonadia bacterium ATM]RIJ96664.1 MAG: thioesterase [Armatimonadota bacterium]
MGIVSGDWVESRIRVRYGETDQMGHAYYANYLFWFEVARGDWCRAHGFTYTSLEEKGLFLPVVEAWVRYKGEIRYDQEITIRVRVAEFKRASIKFEYEVTRDGTNGVLTQGYTWHVLMNRDRKATSIPDWLQAHMTTTAERDSADGA